MNGILNIDKPRGMTSHDVVARIRGIARARRVGHAGTLDPMATGVLLVCLGKATRLVEYLTPGRKRYRAVVCFGATTDTYDAEGQVLTTSNVEITESQLTRVLDEFRGSISQVPPAYSALKKDGQPLYKLARQGVEVERPARRIEIHELTVESWRSPDLVLDVACSAGTYIRSIAHDLGARLGPGAHLSALTRTASGSFTVEDALPLRDVEAAAAQGRFEELLLPPAVAVADLPGIQLDSREKHDLFCGRPLSRDERAEPDTLCSAFDESGALVAVLRFDAPGGRWRPHKVFVEQPTNAK